MSDLDKVPGKAYAQGVHARLWLDGESGSYLGAGRIELLENIQQHGSMSKAAKAMAMSYKRAWALVEAMNHTADQALVCKETGGVGGGGASLTEAGFAAIARYRNFERAFALFAEDYAKTHLAKPTAPVE